MINLHTDLTHYTPEFRPYLADLLRPFVNARTLEQNRAIYGAVVDRYTLTDSLQEADWAVLPLAWNYYHRTRRLGLAFEFIEGARRFWQERLSFEGFFSHFPEHLNSQ